MRLVAAITTTAHFRARPALTKAAAAHQFHGNAAADQRMP